MKIIAYHSHTWTNWAIDWFSDWTTIIKKTFEITNQMKNEIWWIQKYWDFLNQYWWNWHYKTWEDFLKNLIKEFHLKKIHKTDPIEYLIYLYSINWEWLPINEIYNRVKDKINSNIHIETFRRFLVNILWWNLRDSLDRSEYSEKKRIKNKNISWFDQENNKKHKTAQLLFSTKINTLLTKTKQDNIFSIKTFNSFKRKKERNIYLISILLWINTNEVVNYIIELNSVSWYNTIAIWLNKISTEKWILIELTRHDIRRIVNK